MFNQCKDLKKVAFSEALEKIGLYAFYRTGIENLRIPASLRTIAQGAFAECWHLRTVELGEGLEVLGTNERSSYGGKWCGVF